MDVPIKLSSPSDWPAWYENIRTVARKKHVWQYGDPENPSELKRPEPPVGPDLARLVAEFTNNEQVATPPPPPAATNPTASTADGTASIANGLPNGNARTRRKRREIEPIDDFNLPQATPVIPDDMRDRILEEHRTQLGVYDYQSSAYDNRYRLYLDAVDAVEYMRAYVRDSVDPSYHVFLDRRPSLHGMMKVLVDNVKPTILESRKAAKARYTELARQGWRRTDTRDWLEEITAAHYALERVNSSLLEGYESLDLFVEAVDAKCPMWAMVWKRQLRDNLHKEDAQRYSFDVVRTDFVYIGLPEIEKRGREGPSDLSDDGNVDDYEVIERPTPLEESPTAPEDRTTTKETFGSSALLNGHHIVSRDLKKETTSPPTVSNGHQVASSGQTNGHGTEKIHVIEETSSQPLLPSVRDIEPQGVKTGPGLAQNGANSHDARTAPGKATPAPSLPAAPPTRLAMPKVPEVPEHAETDGIKTRPISGRTSLPTFLGGLETKNASEQPLTASQEKTTIPLAKAQGVTGDSGRNSVPISRPETPGDESVAAESSKTSKPKIKKWDKPCEACESWHAPKDGNYWKGCFLVYPELDVSGKSIRLPKFGVVQNIVKQGLQRPVQDYAEEKGYTKTVLGKVKKPSSTRFVPKSKPVIPPAKSPQPEKNVESAPNPPTTIHVNTISLPKIPKDNQAVDKLWSRSKCHFPEDLVTSDDIDLPWIVFLYEVFDDHVFNSEKWFTELKMTGRDVVLNGHVCSHVKGVGQVRIVCANGGQLIIENALYIPSSPTNVLSGWRLSDSDVHHARNIGLVDGKGKLLFNTQYVDDKPTIPWRGRGNE